MHILLNRFAAQTHLPQSSMGKALRYFPNEYTALVGYLRCPEFRIDNNLVENGVRPSAVGRRRWLFIGHPDAGWRSAVLHYRGGLFHKMPFCRAIVLSKTHRACAAAPPGV